jgi:ribulose-phosphate 3-epimerase
MRRERQQTIKELRSSSPNLCPAILQCDYGNLAGEIADAEKCGARVLHLDVMDGHFVPNLSYGPPVIQSLRKFSEMIYDAHLMVTEPLKLLDNYLKAGCDIVTIHLEAAPNNARQCLEQIRAAGVVAGLSIKPNTPVESALPYLDHADLLLVMSVEPGFGGQKFDPRALEKLRALRAALPELILEVDGGIHEDTVADAAAAGADMLVVGSAFYQAPDRRAKFNQLNELLAQPASYRG